MSITARWPTDVTAFTGRTVIMLDIPVLALALERAILGRVFAFTIITDLVIAGCVGIEVIPTRARFYRLRIYPTPDAGVRLTGAEAPLRLSEVVGPPMLIGMVLIEIMTEIPKPYRPLDAVQRRHRRAKFGNA